jgi:hypothetical protein
MLKLELIKIKNEQIKIEQKKIYKKIYYKLIATINLYAEKEINFCLYTVPSFFFDEISFPLDDCIKYLNKRLSYLINDKYIDEIIFFEPNVYYIKWSI